MSFPAWTKLLRTHVSWLLPANNLSEQHHCPTVICRFYRYNGVYSCGGSMPRLFCAGVCLFTGKTFHRCLPLYRQIPRKTPERNRYESWTCSHHHHIVYHYRRCLDEALSGIHDCRLDCRCHLLPARLPLPSLFTTAGFLPGGDSPCKICSRKTSGSCWSACFSAD